MTPKEFLSLARDIDRRIDARLEERERLVARLTAGRSANLSGMPRGGRYDWTNSVAQLADMDARINGQIAEMCRIKRLVWEAIEAVEDMRYRELLEYRYRNCWTWEQIAEAMGYDLRWIHRLHGMALLRVRVPAEFRNTP